MDFKRLDKIYDELKKAYEEAEKAIIQGNTSKIGMLNEQYKVFDIIMNIKSFIDETEFLITELQQLKNNNLEQETGTGSVQ